MNRYYLVFKETFLKDLRNYSTYRFNFFGEIFFNFIVVMMLFYAASVFKGSESLFLEKYNNNYFLFLLTGLMVFLFLTRTFSSLIVFVSGAQNMGYMESMFLTRTDFLLILISSTIFPTLQALVRISIIFFFALFFDPNSLYLANLFEIIVLLIFASIPFVGISLFVASLSIVFKRANFVSSIFLIGCAIFSGIIYPVSVMPAIAQNISLLFPSTYAVEIIRSRLLEELPYSDLIDQLLMISVVSFIYISFGIISLRFAINKAKKEGNLGHY